MKNFFIITAILFSTFFSLKANSQTPLETLPEDARLQTHAFSTQPIHTKSFAIEHKYYYDINGAINFYRGATSNDGYITFSTMNGLERMRLTAYGNFGIGTTDPQAKLHILNTQKPIPTGSILLGDIGPDYSGLSLNGSLGTWNITSSSTDNNLYFNRPSGNSMYFREGQTQDQMVIAPGGNVGIGAPAWEKLTVMGIISSRDPNGGYLFLNSYDGGIELGSGNNAHSFIDFKGFQNLGSDMQGRISYEDNTGFDFATAADYAPKLRIALNGNVGIGTTSINDVNYKLFVKTGIRTEKVKVDLASNWPDYVFDKQYKLPSLKEIEQYIQVNQHLPEVPSADEVHKNGIDLGDNQALLLKKIEELTLIVIDLNKKLENLKKNQSRKNKLDR